MKKDSNKPYVAAGITAFCVVAAAIMFFFLLYHASLVGSFLDSLTYILRPIFLGMIFAFLLLPIHRNVLRFLMAMTSSAKRGDRKNAAFLNFLSIIFSMLFALFLLYLLLAMVIPQVYLSIVGLIQAFPYYINSVQKWLPEFLEDNPEIQVAIMSVYSSAAASFEQWMETDILPNLESITSTLAWVKESVLPNITGMVSNVSAILIAFLVLLKDLLVAFIVAVYLLARKDTFAAHGKKIVYSIFPVHIGDLVVEETRNAYRIMSGFINGKLLDSLIIGIIALICCNLFDFPYPTLLALIIGITNVIPFFGPFIGAIPCALLILLVSPLQCIYFVLFILVLQQFDGNILGPKILGDSTGLASFWVLFSIILFGGLFGFAGMVLGVPIFAMLYSIANRLVRRGLKNHGLPLETEYYLGKTQALAKDGSCEETD